MTESTDPSDDVLIARARAGDAGALRALFDRHAEALRARVATRLSALAKGKVSSSDVLQEAFLTAFERLAHFESRTSDGFRRWLVRIVDFKVREEIRRWVHTDKRAAGREVRLTSGSGGVEVRSPDRSPSNAAVAREEGRFVLDALARLDEDDRSILDLVHRQGLTFPQAGERLGIGAEAARKRHGRALARLGGLVGRRAAP